MQQIIGNYLNTNYTFKEGVRKTTIYNTTFPITLETLEIVELLRPNLNVDTLNTIMKVFSILYGNVTYAKNEQTAPTGVVSAGGSMTVGDHYYYVAFTYGSSETIVGSISSVLTTSSGQQTITLDLTNNLGASACTSRKIYKKTGVGGAWYLRGTIADNTTTTFVDTVVDNTTTAAPTTSTAYDFTWSATLNSEATAVTVAGDRFKFKVDVQDNTKNDESGYISVNEISPDKLQFDSSIPVSSAQAPTGTYVVAGSSVSGEGYNVHRISYTWVQGGGVTESYFKIVGRKATADTNVFGIENVKFDTISPVIIGKDTDGINIYRLVSVASQKFAFTIFTDNNVPELEIQIRAAGTTLTTSNVTIDWNRSFVAPAPKCDTTFYDYGVEVQRGRVGGISAINKFGAAPNGIQTTKTDIWSRADATPTQQIWVAPTTARIHAIVSTSTDDDGNPVGNGARTIRVYGLKTWDSPESSEDIIMDGTTPVNTANSYVIIHRMKVLTSGITNINVGTISATAATDNSVTAIIAPGDGQTEMAIYGVPSTHTLMIKAWGANIDKTGATAVTSDFELRVNENPNVQLLNFLRKDDISLMTTGTSIYEKCKHIPISIPGPAIVKIQAVASAADTDGEAWFDGYLVQN